MNTYGYNIKLNIYGNSHGEKIGMRLEGIPAGEVIDFDRLKAFLARRAPGKSTYVTQRKEADEPIFISGFNENVTTGEVVEAVIYNSDRRSSDYPEKCDIPRPSHADFAAIKKYGENVDLRGGGHFSGRLTAPMCIAGGICLQILEKRGIHIGAHISSVGTVRDKGFDPTALSKNELDALRQKSFPVIEDAAGEEMRKAIESARLDSDSLGGTVECAAIGLPAGLGEHMFMSVEARVSNIIFAIPAVKGIEFGLGFGSSALSGSQNNDPFEIKDGRVVTKTNHSGGILGGMTNGMPLIFRAAIKPTPSIGKEQDSVSLSKMENVKLTISGRHDPCIAPRAVPVFEAACALAIFDMLLDRRESEAELDLAKLREEINGIDREAVELFKKRMAVSALIAEYKNQHSLPILDAQREAALLDRVGRMSGEELSEYTKELYRTVMKLSKEYQKTKLEDLKKT